MCVGLSRASNDEPAGGWRNKPDSKSDRDTKWRRNDENRRDENRRDDRREDMRRDDNRRDENRRDDNRREDNRGGAWRGANEKPSGEKYKPRNEGKNKIINFERKKSKIRNKCSLFSSGLLGFTRASNDEPAGDWRSKQQEPKSDRDTKWRRDENRDTSDRSGPWRKN